MQAITSEPGSRATAAIVASAGILVPAYEAERMLPGVILALREAIPECAERLLVIDDGSRDGTAEVARRLGCIVLRHDENRGKGAALRTGLLEAERRGWRVALTVDADGQHPGGAARSVLVASDDPDALVLGIRDLAAAGAPRANRMSNGISNFFLSRFAGRPLADTQCGLRRYPVTKTLALAPKGVRYEFEAEVLLRAVWAGISIVEHPVEVVYPEDRTTHFTVARDPARIIRRVVATLAERAQGKA